MSDDSSHEMRLRELRDGLESIMGQFKLLQAQPSIRTPARNTAESIGEVLLELDEWMGWFEG